MTDLLLDLNLSGPAASVPQYATVRALVEADIGLLDGDLGVAPPPLARIRDRHHWAARCFAQGMGVTQTAAVTGYSVSRLSILRNDPAFKDLIAFYTKAAQEEYIDMHRRMGTLGADAISELHERLEDKPEDFSIDQLRDLVKTMADRTGFAPTKQSVNVNVNVGMADRLEAARRRAAQIVDATVLEVVND